MTRRRTRANEYRRPVDRRPGSFPGRRLALGIAVMLGAFGIPAAVAGADASSNVLVTATVYASSGTTTDDVTVAALEANPGQCPTYPGESMNELGREGFVDVTLPANTTWSLPTILGCLQTPIPPSSVKGITVIGDNGSPEEGADSELTPADLASPSDFNSPSEYPVVEAAGSENQYDRPWRGSPQGQPDEDFLDEVQSSQNGQPAPISIEVFEGGLLTVTVTASRSTAPAGGTISFSATVTGANGSPLSYSWNFDGGAPNSGAASPQATFASTGQYAVTLQVTDAAGAGGGAEIPINVGPAAPVASGKHKQTGSGTSRKSHSPTGPRKSGGNHAGASAGTHQSQTSGQSNPSTSTTSQTATTPNSSATTPATSGAKTDTTPARATGSHPRTPRRPAPVIKPRAPAPVSGPLVNGQLISDVTLLPAGASPLVHSIPAPAASAPPARQAVRTSPVPALAGAFAVALLLALGAARELRGRRAWHALRLGS